MNLNLLQDPFTPIMEDAELDQFNKFEKLLRVYDREKAKALQLYGTYSIAKVKWLLSKYLQAHNKISCQTKK